MPFKPKAAMALREVALLFFLLVFSGTVGVFAGWKLDEVLSGQDFDEGFVRLLVDSGYTKESISLLNKQLARRRHDSSARLLLARAYCKDENFRAAADVLTFIPDESVHKPEGLLRQAQAHLELYDAKSAEELLNQCVALSDPGSVIFKQAWKELSDIYAAYDRQSDLRRSLEILHQYSASSELPTIMNQMTSRVILRVNPSVRAQELQKFIAGNPKDVRARSALGFAFLEGGDPDRGLPLLEESARLSPDDPFIWRNWLQGLYQKGDFEALRREFARSPKELETESGFWKIKATLAQDRREWENARDCLKRALAMDPNSHDLWTQLATVEARLGNKDLAQQCGAKSRELRDLQGKLQLAFEKWRAIDPDHSSGEEIRDIAFEIASVCRQLGQDTQAAGWMRIVTTIDAELAETKK